MAKKDKDFIPPPKYQAKNDAYTGMLGISLLALVGGCVLLFLDFQNYNFKTKAPTPASVLPVSSDPNAPQPGTGTGTGGGVNGGGVNNPGAAPGSNPAPPGNNPNPAPPGGAAP